MQRLLVGLAAVGILLSIPESLRTLPKPRSETHNGYLAFRTAAAAVPDGSTVMTNAPLAFNVEHHGGVIRIPTNGQSAIVAAIEHYDVDTLVLFRSALEWSDSVTKSIYDEKLRRLTEGIELHRLEQSAEFTILDVVHTD